MFASIPTAAVLGAEGHAVDAEVHVGKGLPGFSIVGLPDESVREARDRVRSAILSSDLSIPDIKVTVNLAPSEQRKTGSGLDLAIAVGILVASEQVPADAVAKHAFIGELGLDGSVRSVPGVVPMVGVLRNHDVVVPVSSAVEAEVAAHGRVRLVESLGELVAVLRGEMPWPLHDPPVAPYSGDVVADMADVQGQPLARQALEIAASGGHHALFVGPPGAGKTMLASRLPGLLPMLDRERSLEATMVHSASGAQLPPTGLVARPPYRSPHHTCSGVALVGGGAHTLRPGEISMAHCGVLFLDEIAEFAPSVLDMLRQPLETKTVFVSRANVKARLPADFLLVAAMNPCPCGGGNSPGGCECNEMNRLRYRRRLSGPLLDRFDLRVPVQPPTVDDLLYAQPGEATEPIAERVAAARAIADRRQGCLNADLSGRRLDQFAEVDDAAQGVLRDRLNTGLLSARGYHRVRRVARTVADLDRVHKVGAADAGEAGPISEPHVHLALRLRTSLSSPAGLGTAA